MNYKTASVLVGLVFWLGWTVAIRTFGHWFFLVDNTVVMLALFLGGFVLILLIARLLFQLLALLVQQVFLAAVLMVMPGMLLDSALVCFYPWVFPNMPPESAALYGAWLLAAYAAVLVAALTWPIGKHREVKRPSA